MTLYVENSVQMKRMLSAFDIWILFFVLAWSELEGSKRSSRPSLNQIKGPKDLKTFHAHVVSAAVLKPGNGGNEDRNYPWNLGSESVSGII